MRQWVGHVVDRRAELRLRDGPSERSRVRVHIEGDPIADVRVRDVDAYAVQAWLSRMMAKKAGGHGSHRRPRPLSAKVVHNCLVLLRRAFAHAVSVGLIERNPARDVEVPRASRTRTRQDFEGVLTADEQAALLCSALEKSQELGAMVAVALGLGLRRGELLSLRWSDVDLHAEQGAQVIVRHGGKDGRPTKSGKPRRLPVFGVARDALVALHGQRLARGELEDAGLLFPGRHGVQRTKVPRAAFRAALREAGIVRPVRWHDLRHTCATSLLCGWWGPAWSLTAVQHFLGHADQATTERYVHVRGELLFSAAKAMAADGDASETLQVNETRGAFVPTDGAGYAGAGHGSRTLFPKFR